MTGIRSTLRQQIRVTKNSLVQRYFKLRIHSTRDPYQVVGRSQPLQILLILSHMRSGSSLLSHLLNANPEIVGYGETHTQYDSPADVKRLLDKVYCNVPEFRRWQDVKNFRMNHRYVFDKVLHDSRLPDPTLLASPSVTVIFLVRQPERSLVSLRDLKPHWDDAIALAYYTERLGTLQAYARHMGDRQRMLFLTYEQLLDRTEPTLKTLQTFLKTTQPFGERYEILRSTGVKGVGDSKGNINAGKIVRQARSIKIEVQPEAIAAAQLVYQNFYQVLSQLCTTVPNE